jgi:hypothetical protein
MLGIIRNSVGFFLVGHKFRYSLVEALWPLLAMMSFPCLLLVFQAMLDYMQMH